MNYEIRNGVATYTGPLNAVEIAQTLNDVKSAADTENIREFRATILNKEWDIVESLQREHIQSAGHKGYEALEGDASNVVIRYVVTRVASVVGSYQPTLLVPDPIDLAHRRVV